MHTNKIYFQYGNTNRYVSNISSEHAIQDTVSSFVLNFEVGKKTDVHAVLASIPSIILEQNGQL
jgi:hypothetical protein